LSTSETSFNLGFLNLGLSAPLLGDGCAFASPPISTIAGPAGLIAKSLSESTTTYYVAYFGSEREVVFIFPFRFLILISFSSLAFSAASALSSFSFSLRAFLASFAYLDAIYVWILDYLAFINSLSLATSFRISFI
jgi:hypothetical protein